MFLATRFKVPLVTLLFASCAAGACYGKEVHVGGVSFLLPPEWELDATSAPRTWRQRATGSAGGTRLQVTHCEGHISMSPLGGERVGASLARRLAATEGIEDVEVRAVDWVELDRTPGYRVRLAFRSSLGGESRNVEELVYAIAGSDTVLLTFSSTREHFSTAESRCDAIVATLKVNEPYLYGVPPWFCCALLSGCAGFSATARRWRRRVGAQRLERLARAASALSDAWVRRLLERIGLRPSLLPMEERRRSRPRREERE